MSQNQVTDNKKLTFKLLGTGSSTGVPIIACPCPICHSSHPRNKRLRPSALITTPNGENILIDTSPDLRQQALTHNITHLEAVIITHTHADHVLGFDDLRAFSFGRPEHHIHCYAIPETMESLKQVFSYIFFPPPRYKGGLLAQVELHNISQTTPFTVCGIEFTPFKLIHGSIATTGFRFGDTAYVTDCNEIPLESKEALRGLNTVIIDGLRDIPHATHFSIDQAIAVTSELGIKQVYITHLSHSVDYETVSASLPQNVHLAYDGLCLEVNI